MAPNRYIEAAGGALWRPALGGPGVEVALVHRPKYDDWSLPKGKLTTDEHPIIGAVREVWEETGFQLDPADLLGPVAHRHVVHGYSDRVIEQDESFYLALVPDFTVDTSNRPIAHVVDDIVRWVGTDKP